MERVMVRSIFAIAIAIACLLPASIFAQGAVVPGVVTANNVDITADNGEILSDRLNAGDPIFIVANPKENKKGWMRVTRDAEDAVGIGWVEKKNIRTISRWRSTEAGEGAVTNSVSSRSAPSVTPAEEEDLDDLVFGADDFELDLEPEDRVASVPTSTSSSPYSNVGLMPFQAGDPSDPTAKRAYDAFSAALKKNGSFQVNTDSLKSERADIESTAALKEVSEKHRLDGVFVGNVSPEIAGSRLLQVRFYGKDKNSFVVEQVKKLPSGGDIQSVMDELVGSVMDQLSGP